jgi:hypothetical protein
MTAQKLKNPLKNDVIIERAFSAKMLPPGDSATAFLFPDWPHPRNFDFVSGITEAAPAKSCSSKYPGLGQSAHLSERRRGWRRLFTAGVAFFIAGAAGFSVGRQCG